MKEYLSCSISGLHLECPSALSATDSTQPSNQLSGRMWGSYKDQGDAYVALKNNVDPNIIVIDSSSDEDSSDDEPPDQTLSVHLLATDTASYASGRPAGMHTESISHFMASIGLPQHLDPAASAYPGTSTYICPPLPAAIALTPGNSGFPGPSISSGPGFSSSSYSGPSVNTCPPQHPGDIMCPSTIIHSNGSTSNHYNGPSMPICPPQHPAYMYPDHSSRVKPGSSIPNNYQSPAQSICPPQPPDDYMDPGLNYYIKQASTSSCTTTFLPLVSSSLYPNDVEMISPPVSTRITDLLDEVEDMVDYDLSSSSSTQTAATLLTSIVAPQRISC